VKRDRLPRDLPAVTPAEIDAAGSQQGEEGSRRGLGTLSANQKRSLACVAQPCADTCGVERLSRHLPFPDSYRGELFFVCDTPRPLPRGGFNPRTFAALCTCACHPYRRHIPQIAIQSKFPTKPEMVLRTRSIFRCEVS
jgi:hypothetical protein